MLVVLLVRAAFIKFWWRLPVWTRALFLMAVTVFLMGAMGTEMISAVFIAEAGGADGYYYRGVLTAIEEGLEKIGVVILLYALLDYLRRQKVTLAVSSA